MLPSRNLEKEAAKLKTSDAIDIMHLPLLKDGRSKTDKATGIDDNSIINSSKTDDDYYSDDDSYYYYDDVVNVTDTVTTTSKRCLFLNHF